ncbi:MAG: hypothetical protein MJ101_06305 [Clostridia bacterium]|nr:hypothetical protein [Clostridia bacterium]
MRNPAIPMMALAGAPSRSELYDYLSALHGVGIEQIMLYPRKGCEISYMSSDWWRTMDDLMDALTALDMTVWLNDDFHFPSGNANGAVTSRDEFCLKSITVRGENKGRRNLTPGQTRYADVLCYDAVSAFIEESHEQYYRRYAPLFGNVIAGFYSDEPACHYRCSGDDLPYYAGMEQDYADRYGRDFDSDLQCGHGEFYVNCNTLISERFAQSYPCQISEWCRAHNCLWAGHLYDDDSPLKGARTNGDTLRVLREFAVPGVDEIQTKLTDERFLCLCGALDYARGDSGAMCEIFALGPCDMPYAKQIAMINMMAAFGADKFFLAISHLSVKGNRIINNFFSHFGPARPDCNGIKELCACCTDAARRANIGFTPDCYIRYPSSLYAENILDNLQAQPLPDTEFSTLINTLSAHQIQWRFTAEDDEKRPCEVALTKSGYTLDGEAVTLDALCEKLQKPLRVTTKTGGIPTDLFVRKLNDGSLLVVNRTETPGDYLIDGKNAHIESYGVVTHAAPEMTVLGKCDVVCPITYENDNCARLMYINDGTTAELEATDDIDVIFSVREECTAAPDGVPLTTHECNSMGKEFSILYGDTDTVHITKGVHTVTSGNDYKYLPSVMARGDFSVSYVSGDVCRAIISKRKTEYCSGERFEDHGVVSYTLTTDVPEGATAIEIKGEPLYCELWLGDKCLGTHAAPPFVFDLPRLDGRTTLTFKQFSSLSSLFGDVNYFNYHQNAIRWRSTLPSHPARFGFDSVIWLKNKQ